MNFSFFITRFAAACLGACMLAACGGSTDVAGAPGTGGTGTRSGLITGFGSVYIDGQKFDDSQIQPTQQMGSNETVTTVFALGQRVSVDYDPSTWQLKAAKISPHLSGPVQTVNAAAGWLQVLGQPVRVATTAAPYADRPGFFTQIVNAEGAVIQLSDIKVGDWLELHGYWLQDMPNPTPALTNAPVSGLLASRVQILKNPRDEVLVSGQVSVVEGAGSAKRASVTTADGRQLLFDNSAPGLVSGQLASLWVKADSAAKWSDDSPLDVGSIHVPVGATDATSAAVITVMTGPVQAWVAQTAQLQINGHMLTVPPALLTPQLSAALASQTPPTQWQIVLTRGARQAPWTVLRIDPVKVAPVSVSTYPFPDPQPVLQRTNP
jgi:hypothetical protein